MSIIEKNREKTSNALLATQGKIKATLRIDNVQIADLYNGEFFKSSLCVYDDIIIGYKDLEAETVIDGKGAYLLPNFMDAHVHIESSMLSPARFAELVIPFGTGTVIADPHEIANVQGMDGIKFMLASAKSAVLINSGGNGIGANSEANNGEAGTLNGETDPLLSEVAILGGDADPLLSEVAILGDDADPLLSEVAILGGDADPLLDVRIMLPSCVPALPFEDAGANLLASDLEELIEHKKVLGLGEMMNVLGVVNQDKEVMDKINLAKKHGKMIDGHSPAINANTLDSYALAGVKTDHECTKPEEVWDRLRRGMYVLMREGSAAHDLLNLIPSVNAYNARYCMFCTDDRHPADIVKRGHINTLVRMAVEVGIAPIQAIRMASLNTAECYGLENKGALAVGMEASFMLVNFIGDAKNAMDNFTPHAVFIKGKKVAEKGKLLDFKNGQSQVAMSDGNINQSNKNIENASTSSNINKDKQELEKLTALMRKSMNFVMPENFDIPVKSGKARLIRVCAHSLFTQCEIAPVGIDDKGNFDFSKNKGVLKIAVIERHKGTGKIGLGLLHEQYGLQNGAIATTIAHDSHNIVVAGDNDADMFLAIKTLKEIGGGIVMASQGKVLASLELPLGGLMSEESGHVVAEKLENLLSLAKSHYKIWDKADAFMTLSFLALPVIPEIKLTASGLFDVNTFSFVSVDAGE